MLYSHSEEDEKVKQFAIFLNHAARGDEKYAHFVNDILIETHEYAVGKKSLYNINRDSFHIILLLSEADSNFFSHLQDNPSQFNAATYNEVLKIMYTPKVYHFLSK